MKKFVEKCTYIPDPFLFIVKWQIIIKNQVLSVVLLLKHSLPLKKKIKSELLKDKQSSLSWCITCAIQNWNNCAVTVTVTFDAKKAKETLMMGLSESQQHYWNKKVC